jgi:hypothetical protein
MSGDTKLRLHNITSRATLNSGTEIWTLNGEQTQKLKAAQTNFHDIRPEKKFWH